MIKAILWTAATILVTFVAISFADATVILISGGGFSGVIDNATEFHKLVEVILALLCAVGVEQVFVVPRASHYKTFALGSLFALFLGICLIILNHYPHQKSHLSYDKELQRARIVLDSLPSIENDTQSSIRLESIVSNLKSITEQIADASNKHHDCSCRIYASIILFIFTVMAVFFRYRMFKDEKEANHHSSSSSPPNMAGGTVEKKGAHQNG